MHTCTQTHTHISNCDSRSKPNHAFANREHKYTLKKYSQSVTLVCFYYPDRMHHTQKNDQRTIERFEGVLKLLLWVNVIFELL